jgi:alkylation response protein AidB-like acyl-CoA dehydrogenase
VKERRAFGRPIADFQSTQFRLADMATELEVARSFLWRACAKLDSKAPDATQFCAMAKRHVTDTCHRIADEALQLLGGYGYLADYGVEKLVRDCASTASWKAPTRSCASSIARQLLRGR